MHIHTYPTLYTGRQDVHPRIQQLHGHHLQGRQILPPSLHTHTHIPSHPALPLLPPPSTVVLLSGQSGIGLSHPSLSSFSNFATSFSLLDLHNSSSSSSSSSSLPLVIHALPSHFLAPPHHHSFLPTHTLVNTTHSPPSPSFPSLPPSPPPPPPAVTITTATVSTPPFPTPPEGYKRRYVAGMRVECVV